MKLGRFGRAVSLVAGGTALGQAITIASTPFLTRLYGPGDLGLLAVYASLLGIVSIVSGLRYEMAVPLPERDDVAVRPLALAAISVGTIAAAMCLVVSVAGEWALGLARAEALAPWAWLFPIGLAGAGLYQLLGCWAVRRREYAVMARTKIGQAGGQAIVQVGLGALGAGPIGLLLGHVVGVSAGITSFLARFGPGLASAWSAPGAPSMRDAARRYASFPLYLAPAALVNSAGRNLPMLLMAILHGTGAAGFFLLADRLLNVPLTLVGNSISQVFFGEAAEAARTDPDRVRRLYVGIAGRLLAAGVVPALALALLGEWLFALFFGAEWRDAGRFAAALTPMFLARFVTSPLAIALTAVERQKWTLLVQLVLLAAAAGSIGVATAWGFRDYSTVLLYSGVMTAAYSAAFAIVLVQVGRAAPLATRALASPEIRG
jgi:O-antigen/teichoic acid export membrane protein